MEPEVEGVESEVEGEVRESILERKLTWVGVPMVRTPRESRVFMG